MSEPLRVGVRTIGLEGIFYEPNEREQYWQNHPLDLIGSNKRNRAYINSNPEIDASRYAIPATGALLLAAIPFFQYCFGFELF